MEKKNQIAHVRAEKNILASAQNPWIVELKCSFQDDKYLYLVMEYLAGGDLMTLLMKKDILSEDEAKFYMAEAVSPFILFFKSNKESLYQKINLLLQSPFFPNFSKRDFFLIQFKTSLFSNRI